MNKQLVDDLLEIAKWYSMQDEHMNTIEKAIKALGNGDTDCISRQAAIEEIEKLQMPIMRSEDVGDQFKFCGLGMAREVLIELPPVTPQQKVGRWIPYKVENEKNVILNDDLSKEEILRQQDWVEEYEPCYICSCCGKTNFYRDFCPNCGAKNVEPQERSEKE